MAAETASAARPVPEPTQPVEIFYSYAHTDEALRQELLKHMALLQRQGYIVSWHDRLIPAGGHWAGEIDSHLESADIILLLISADFLASEYCYGIEMRRALEREKDGEARVIPILLRSVYWKNAPFAHLQALPSGAKAVDSPAWANHDEAFTNIVEGLSLVIDELTNKNNGSQPTPSSQPSARIWTIPFERNALFTGREDVLKQLHEALSKGRTAALTQSPQAISGLGGIGKTQTAIEYAYRHRDEYRYVFWVRAETQQELASDYTTLADLLHLPERRLSNQDQKVATVRRWLQANTDWLLILDNADDLSLAQAFLPIGSRGHIILTTRTQVVGRLAQRVEIERMEPEEGSLFLLHRARLLKEDVPLEKASPSARARALEIVQEVDGLPLALEQAGAYIEETFCGLDGYLRDYRTQRADLLNHRGSAPNPDYRETVATTWTLAFQKVEAANPAAADLLRLCAFLSPDSIPEEIVTEGATDLGPHLKALSNSTKLNAAIAELLKYSLIKRDPDAHILSLHRLVQAVLLDPMPTRTRRTWAERATRAVYKAFPKRVEYATWPQCQRMLLSAQACVSFLKQYQLAFRQAAILLTKAGWYIQTQDQYAQALPLYQLALDIYEQISGPEHTDAAIGLNNLALLYYKQDQYAQAEPLYQRSLAICESILGADHPRTAIILDNLARLCHKQERYEQAEQYFQRALSIRERVLGPEHPDTAVTLNNLAQLYHKQGLYKKAEQYLQRALRIRERVLGPEHPDTAVILLNIAVLYQKQGRYEEALFQRALAIDEKVFGPEHPEVATDLEWYADMLREMGRVEEARRLEERAKAIRERWAGM